MSLLQIDIGWPGPPVIGVEEETCPINTSTCRKLRSSHWFGTRAVKWGGSYGLESWSYEDFITQMLIWIPQGPWNLDPSHGYGLWETWFSQIKSWSLLGHESNTRVSYNPWIYRSGLIMVLDFKLGLRLVCWAHQTFREKISSNLGLCGSKII